MTLLSSWDVRPVPPGLAFIFLITHLAPLKACQNHNSRFLNQPNCYVGSVPRGRPATLPKPLSQVPDPWTPHVYLLDISGLCRTLRSRDHIHNHKALLFAAPSQQLRQKCCQLLLGNLLAAPMCPVGRFHPPHADIQSGDHRWGKGLLDVALLGTDRRAS